MYKAKNMNGRRNIFTETVPTNQNLLLEGTSTVPVVSAHYRSLRRNDGSGGNEKKILQIIVRVFQHAAAADSATSSSDNAHACKTRKRQQAGREMHKRTHKRTDNSQTSCIRTHPIYRTGGGLKMLKLHG